jgi:hypothetical protein
MDPLNHSLHCFEISNDTLERRALARTLRGLVGLVIISFSEAPREGPKGRGDCA